MPEICTSVSAAPPPPLYFRLPLVANGNRQQTQSDREPPNPIVTEISRTPSWQRSRMILPGGAASPAAELARRTSEKTQIRDITERLGDYIRNVRTMRNQLKQGDNTSAVQHLQEELIAVRSRYEKEIGQHREKMEGARDRLGGPQSNVMAAEYQSRLLEMSRDLVKKDEEIGALQLLVAQKESDIQALRGAAISPSIQLDWAKQELSELQGNIILAQGKYEEEFSQRLTLQEQLRELTHHMEDMTQTHMKESQDLRSQVAQSQALVLQLEDKLRSISRGGPALAEAVQRIQEASEAELQRLQSETESVYNQNLLELHLRLNNDQILLEEAQSDNHRLHEKVEELSTEVTSLQKKLFDEGAASRALMEKLQEEHLRDLQHIRALEARLEELQDLLLAKMKELNTFEESNVSLRSELDALKSMLEEEEQQMSVGNWHFPATSSSSSNPLTESFPSPVHHIILENYKTGETLPPIETSSSTEPLTTNPTEERSLEDEKIGKDSQEQSEFRRSLSAPVLSNETLDLSRRPASLGSMVDNMRPNPIGKTPLLTRSDRTTAVSSALGNLEISDVDPSGNFVRIVNNSADKEENIGGCLLQQNIRGHPVSIYRFPPKTRVMARCALTVWGSSSGAAHNPPTDFLWKEQSSFVTEPRCTTILCTPNGQALAWFTPRKHKTRKLLEKNSLQSEQISPEDASEQQKKDEEAPGTPPVQHRPEKVPPLLRREKISPAVIPVISSPWTQSTASPTHPDFTPSRMAPLGSDGSSRCGQMRLPSAGVPGAGSRPGRDSAITPASRKRRGPTRSAGVGRLRLLLPGSFAPPSAQHRAAIEILQSVQNLDFHPPMPPPPAPTSW